MNTMQHYSQATLDILARKPRTEAQKAEVKARNERRVAAQKQADAFLERLLAQGADQTAACEAAEELFQQLF